MRTFHPFALTNTVKIIAGVDAVQELVPLLERVDCKHPFLLMSKGASASGIRDMLMMNNRGHASSVNYTTIKLSTTEISTKSVLPLVEHYTTEGCDGLVAVGGGTIIDLAKLVRLSLLGIPTAQVHYEGTYVSEENLSFHHTIPLIAIPTTIGSGSGASKVAYVYSSDVNRPLRFEHTALYPHSVILDPKLSKAVSPAQTAMEVAAILGRAMESITSVLSGPVSESFAIHAIHLLQEHSFRVINTPHDLEARLGIAIASHLVGIASSITRGGLAHSASIALEKIAHISYGQSMLILLPHALRFALGSSATALEHMAAMVGACGKKTGKSVQQVEKDALTGITWVNDFFTSITASITPPPPRRFYDIEDSEKKQRLLRPDQLEELASRIIDNTDLLSSRRIPTVQEIVSVLEAAYWGYSLDQNSARNNTIQMR